MTDTLHPLEPFEHIVLKDGTHIWFSQEPEEASASSGPIYLVSAMSPTDSEYNVPPHFHPYSDKYMLCVAGQVDMFLDGVKVTLRPEDGESKIPKGVIHSIHCPKGQYAEILERQDPDPAKQREFLISLFEITEASSCPALQIFTLFYENGDIFPGNVPKVFGILLVYIMGGFFGSFLGFGKRRKVKDA